MLLVRLLQGLDGLIMSHHLILLPIHSTMNIRTTFYLYIPGISKDAPQPPSHQNLLTTAAPVPLCEPAVPAPINTKEQQKR